jgi:8-oxo-dGTP pyrophosphatase MutT (NUDIX family)
MTLGVRGLVTDQAGRVLLVRHTYTPGWHFPGGGVERGETCGEALTRELAEEAGVIPTGSPVLVSVHANHAAFPNDHVLLYRILDWRRTQPADQGEIAEIGWFSPDAAPADVTPGTLRRIREQFAHAPVSADW